MVSDDKGSRDLRGRPLDRVSNTAQNSKLERHIIFYCLMLYMCVLTHYKTKDNELLFKEKKVKLPIHNVM